MNKATLDTGEKSVQWNVGDWCFFEFELGMVKRVTSHGGYEVGNGTTACSGELADRMFPLDYKILQISTHFAWYHRALHTESEGFNLNWPDIHRWFADKWADACRHKDDDEYTKRILDELATFVREVRSGMQDIRHKVVGGIQAFARR